VRRAPSPIAPPSLQPREPDPRASLALLRSRLDSPARRAVRRGWRVASVRRPPPRARHRPTVPAIARPRPPSARQRPPNVSASAPALLGEGSPLGGTLSRGPLDYAKALCGSLATMA
jgi:hypothetical protein